MTQLEILKYAYSGILAVWSREYDRYNEHPDNPFTKARFEMYDEKLNEIVALLYKEEQKQSEQ